MDIIPNGQRLIVEKIVVDFEKSAGGIIVETEHSKTESKNNLIKAQIKGVGTKCELFKEEQIGLVVLIHEVAGVPMHGQNPKLVIIHENDVWAYSTKPLEDFNINMRDVLADHHKISPGTVHFNVNV